MDNEIDTTKFELDLESVDTKIMQLANEMIKASLSDKAKAEETFTYIKTLINKTEEENAKVEEEIQLAKDEGRKPDRVYKRSVTGLLEQLNKSLDISISSTEKLVDLANICTKLKSIDAKQSKGDFGGLRSQLLKEIKDEQK